MSLPGEEDDLWLHMLYRGRAFPVPGSGLRNQPAVAAEDFALLKLTAHCPWVVRGFQATGGRVYLDLNEVKWAYYSKTAKFAVIDSVSAPVWRPRRRALFEELRAHGDGDGGGIGGTPGPHGFTGGVVESCCW